MHKQFIVPAGFSIADGSSRVIIRMSQIDEVAAVVQMELSRIIISETNDEQVIILKEVEGDRAFPIVIGIGEAMAIHRRLNGEQTPRPMTHDLMADVIQKMGGTLEKIVVEDLRFLSPDDSRQTFIATLHVRLGDELIDIDSRPSDAIALVPTNDER